MAWQRSTKGYNTAKWQQLRAFVLERDGRRCYICHGLGADDVDHVRPRSQGGTDHPANLAACHRKPCHSKKSAREGAAAAAQARRVPGRRIPADHPGLIS